MTQTEWVLFIVAFVLGFLTSHLFFPRRTAERPYNVVACIGHHQTEYELICGGGGVGGPSGGSGSGKLAPNKKAD